MSAAIKTALARFPVGEVVLFRSLFAVAVLVAWLAWRGEFPHALHTRRKLGHIGRSIAGSGGRFANFVALSLPPLADAGRNRAFLSLGGGGARLRRRVVMLSEHLGEGLSDSAAAARSSMGVMIALAGAAGPAVAMIQARRLTQSEPTGAIVFYFSSLTAAIGAALLGGVALWPAEARAAAFMCAERFVAPSLDDFVLLASIGVFEGAGQILMTHGYRFADASVIAAFDYVAMIWAAALGYALFAETPSPPILFGATIAAGAGVFVIRREHSARRIRRVAAAAVRGQTSQAA